MRIGINVPDELLKRMQPVRQVTNLSQICRRAVEDWVGAYERAKDHARADGMEAVAARLLTEHARQSVDWEALGYEDAKLWVQMASLVDFGALFHNLKVQKREGRSDNFIPLYRHLEGTKTFLHRQHEHQEWFYRQLELDEKADHFQAAGRKYTHAWLSYVTAVWQMVKDGIEADAKVREAALTKARAELDVPAHLVGPIGK